MTRAQLTDEEWEFVGPYLPIGEYGVSRAVTATVRGCDLALKAGGLWRELPQEFGAWSTVHNRFWRWCDAGVFEALLKG
ncbi:transposase [Streptomyces sp. NPDC002669]|uniref:transposase n=1 Tax=Streptomyces sp. NPDC002669 TaxID=3364658 RepID=UPI00367CE931